MGGIGREEATDAREERMRRSLSEASSPRGAYRETSPALLHHLGLEFHEVFQLKQGCFSDLPAAKISEMMKSNSLHSAPTQTLFSVINRILDESDTRKTGEIPQRVSCLLRKIVQEIERRISSQAEHIRNQNNLIKAREEKYQSRVKVLETLASGTTDETQILMNQLLSIKTEKKQIEEKNKLGEQDIARLLKEKDHSEGVISELRHDLEAKEKSYEHNCQQLETKARESKLILEKNLQEVELLLAESRRKMKELEEEAELKLQGWKSKEQNFHNNIGLQLKSIQDLKTTSMLIKYDVVDTQARWGEEFASFRRKLKILTDAADNYYRIADENRRLYNEVQDLKGNIRVYCRIRPFPSGEKKKPSIIEYIGENGELVLGNHSKQAQRVFKFNRVFEPAASQEDVFFDIQPLIRSVLDGYNVCIFAYGQTGSGKTYTMSGPSSSKEDWGVNYRALNDLFDISVSRRHTCIYEVGVQMVEIYNEQVRDLLSDGGPQKRLGIWSISQPNGLSVPDAIMLPVKSTLDVLDLMQVGLANRSVGATALNNRSSRSHCVLTVHVRGEDLKTGATLHGSLHLVDLAGSERVDRSKATGDRLKEAQNINKSLSALGDVIFALSQKSAHVPYRNSKLTQVLQSSLGGQAKTLMLVQINPDLESYSETFSTLKFAERVSGVELGAARSTKEGRDVKNLMEQVTALQNTIARKDDEIEKLQLLKSVETRPLSKSNVTQGSNSLRHFSSSPVIQSLGRATQQVRRSSAENIMKIHKKIASDPENYSNCSDKHSEDGSHQLANDLKHSKETMDYPEFVGMAMDQRFLADTEPLGSCNANSQERLGENFNGSVSTGSETDSSSSSVHESSLVDHGKPSDIPTLVSPGVPSIIPLQFPPVAQTRTTQKQTKDSSRTAGSRTNTSHVKTSSARPPRPWQ